MTIHHTFAQNKVIIELEGELGHHEAIRIMEKIGEIIDVHLPKEVTLNLMSLNFMDSSGIAVIMQTSKLCKEIGATFTVSKTPKQAMRVLSAAGIQKMVRFE